MVRPAPAQDAFVTKINAAGSALVYSTCLGCKKEKSDISGIFAFDRAEAIAVDSAGHAYVTGWTDARDFPVTAVRSSHVMVVERGTLS